MSVVVVVRRYQRPVFYDADERPVWMEDIHCPTCDAEFSNNRKDGEGVGCPECGAEYAAPPWEKEERDG